MEHTCQQYLHKARFVTGNYLYETGSMTGILEQLKWESLKKRRRDSRIIMLYKGLKGAASIPTNDLVPPIRHVRNHHSLAFQTPFANTDIYKCSFFPQTIRDWNSLTDTFLSAAEGAEDSVAKFTSLVRAPVLSGVPQGTVLGPVLFSLYINDITTDIDSEIRLFADDCVCYREIKGTEDTVKLQEDIDRLGCWARKWGMRSQPVKCNIMQITRKRIKKINASYNLEGTILDNVENIKYLGVTISTDLKWNTHVSNICTKANRTLGFLRRNLSACPQDVKESAYKGLVRPVLEYGSSVWDPSSILLQEELEKVQKRAARFVTGNYLYETGSMTGILEQLKWESLKKRRRDSRIIMLYKGLKDAASIPTNDLVPPIRHVRNHHSLAFQTPFANTDIYKCSFFPQTIRDWNSLTDTFLSAAEGAEDSVA